MNNPIAPGYKLAQLVRPSRKIGEQPVILAERYIRHEQMEPHEVAVRCFERWGLMRKGLAVRCKPVTAQDLGMVELPAVERSGTG